MLNPSPEQPNRKPMINYPRITISAHSWWCDDNEEVDDKEEEEDKAKKRLRNEMTIVG